MTKQFIVETESVKEHIGFCIFCGAPGTGDEHIFPLWSGGASILTDGSCKQCETIINREIESPMSRGPFWSARLYMGLTSRRGHRDPLPVTLLDADGSERRVRVTREENPGILSLVTFPGPNIYVDSTPTKHPPKRHVVKMVSHRFNVEASRRFAERYPSPYLALGWIEIVPLSRLLAKIAHGLAVLQHGPFEFSPILREFILHGKSLEEASHYVGSDETSDKTDSLHESECYWENIRGIDHLVYKITLFAFAGMPVYKVVVGTRPEWTTVEEAAAVWLSNR